MSAVWWAGGGSTTTGATSLCSCRMSRDRSPTAISSADRWRASRRSWTILRACRCPPSISTPYLKRTATTATTRQITTPSTPCLAPRRTSARCAARLTHEASTLFWTVCSTTPAPTAGISTRRDSIPSRGRPRARNLRISAGTASTRGPRTTMPGGAYTPCRR